MKKLIVVWSIFFFSLLYSFPAESLNRNAMLIKILNEVQILKEKSAQQETKLNEILSVLSKQHEEYQKQISAQDEETVKLLKDIKDLIQQLRGQYDD